MTARITLTQIITIAVAFIGGAIIGRGFLAKQDEASSKPAEVADVLPSSSASPMVETAQDRSVTQQRLWSSKASEASKKSLDAILADRDARHRIGNLEAFINGLQPAEYADALKRIRRIPATTIASSRRVC